METNLKKIGDKLENKVGGAGGDMGDQVGGGWEAQLETRCATP